jgi:VWFA-related protein
MPTGKFFARVLFILPISGLLICSYLAPAQVFNKGKEPPPPSMSAPSAPQDSTPTFKSSSRLVVVDVVVTAPDGNPISGLDKSNFTVMEDGKPQVVRAFEPHVPVKEMAAAPDINLPPDEFTNFPKQASNSAVNVVLFDILNTPTDDQMFARQEMIDFLKTLPRGQRVALFTLGYDLRMVAGFTTNTNDLIAAAEKVRPGVSALLDTEKDMEQEDHMNSLLNPPGGNAIGAPPGSGGVPIMAGGNSMGPLGAGGTQNAANPGDALNMGQALQEFMTESRLVRNDVRMEKTFESMGALARALSGYTGRKNLLWLSEGFPAGVLPRREYFHPDARNYLWNFQKYSGLLEASQISVYPIDIRGLKNTTLQPAGGFAEQASSDRQNGDAGDSQLMMKDVAEQTGGRAFYNGNDLKGAMRRSIEHGSTYYTLAYSPENKKWNGDFRRIQVKLDRPNTKLAYRQGYYAVPDDPGPADTARRMLIAEMQPGVPESTMLLLRVKVGSDNGGKVTIDYGVYAADIAFTGDPLKHAKLEFVAVAWDKNEKSAGNVSQTMDLDLKPETFQKVMNMGVPAHQELTLKPGQYKLRLGVMDYTSSKIGTLEIPVTVGVAQTASK